MNTKSYEFVLETGFAGAIHREVVELGFESTEEDVEEEFQTWKNNLIEGYWMEVIDEHTRQL